MTYAVSKRMLAATKKRCSVKYVSCGKVALIMDLNSPVNQMIKREFVQREVYASVNTMTQFILQKGFENQEAPFSYDDIENYYRPGEEDPQDIFEWWIVSDFLIDLLKEKGEPVIPCESIWGRTQCGQAIFMDSVITEICLELGLLK